MVIQALFLKMHGKPPPVAEREAFCDRLNDIRHAGGRIKLVQVYTVARNLPNAVDALSDGEVDAIVEQVQRETGLHAGGVLRTGMTGLFHSPEPRLVQCQVAPPPDGSPRSSVAHRSGNRPSASSRHATSARIG